jgi:hypothetical protein
MPKVADMGIGKKGEMWWITTFPANKTVWIPLSVQRIGAFKEGEKIRVTIRKEVSK